MRDIAALVFGTGPADPADPAEAAEPRVLRERRAPREPFAPRDAPLCDGPPVPSGDWCQTQPGHGTLARLFGVTRSGSARRPPRAL